ncbi:IspD/TarI family cytidylyltransferase [Eubacterium oxidoreducens]|uniref:Ribitol-5-phosphate cytidylyltransferase n=1 Tax=Eubacterium oxidoreducens TaxID=1732 RepID=A0A1G6ADE1_EUBOX|nr:2-C-methyl-D-erythritol 4-phosphate cytidylyltransferase [Eubacterium oxidoreducens]SDB06346.1 2-C-methyl-D-erythritol 4-phosphate cytidylyltransferase [Eubacterium oxidoreducens]
MNQNNVYAVILAGGNGTRMGAVSKPKQFLLLGKKPILVHTVEKFFSNKLIDTIIVLTPKQWMDYTKELLATYFPQGDRLQVIEGGAQRNETIMNAIAFIESEYGMNEQTVIVTHDAARPFVTGRIIMENIASMESFDACATAVAATDTIMRSNKEGRFIEQIPDRRYMYQQQTPQTFKAQKLKEQYDALSFEEKDSLTDACKIMVLSGENVCIVEGERENIKITYPLDLKVAEVILEQQV